MKFKPWLAVTTTGEQEIGSSPYGTVSVLSSGLVCTVGVIIGTTFVPHPDGDLAAGEMLTFEVGKGRRLAVDVTSGTGAVSTSEI